MTRVDFPLIGVYSKEEMEKLRETRRKYYEAHNKFAKLMKKATKQISKGVKRDLNPEG